MFKLINGFIDEKRYKKANIQWFKVCFKYFLD